MTVFSWLLGSALACSWVYWALCIVAARRWRAGRIAGPGALPPVTIIKPLCGLDPELEKNLESFCRQEYPAYQVVFVATDPADPGLEIARRVAAAHPEQDIALLDGSPEAGRNLKVCNLAHAETVAKHDLIVVSDSDMRVSPDYLRRITSPFGESGVGVVTCLYRAENARGCASAFEALGIGADFIPSVLVAHLLEGTVFGFGSTLAVRRVALERIGGFTALADEIADDYMLVSRVREAGYRAGLSDYVAMTVLGRKRFGDMWAQRLRWSRTVRAIRPWGTTGALVTHGTVIALLLGATVGVAPWWWAVLCLTVVLRASAAVCVSRHTGDSAVRRLAWLLPVSDLLSFALWIGGFASRNVVWRGRKLRT